MRDNNFELLKKGDVSALESIYAQYSRRIFWIGKRLIKDEFVIETLVQDSFLKLWIHRDTIESPKHIFFFLRFVMKRECICYYTRPGNKFYRKLGHLENYENYQEYMVGYDPLKEYENIKDQEKQQKRFEQIKQVLPLLDHTQKHLINLCLKYGFRYKIIAGIMGTSITETTNEVKRTIQDIKNIIYQGNTMNGIERPASKGKALFSLTKEQEEVMKLRCKNNFSFEEIAESLNLPQKKVRSEFITAYKLLKEKHQESNVSEYAEVYA